MLKYLLGFDKVTNYDGSWTEWGNLVGVSVERGEAGTQPKGDMKAEHFQERELELSGWAVCLSSYLLGREWHCKADNVSPGLHWPAPRVKPVRKQRTRQSHAPKHYLPERSVTSSNDGSGASMAVQFAIVAKGREGELPWAMKNVELGTDVLEIGPGFGATTAAAYRSGSTPDLRGNQRKVCTLTCDEAGQPQCSRCSGRRDAHVSSGLQLRQRSMFHHASPFRQRRYRIAC